MALYFFVAQPYVPGDGLPGSSSVETESFHWRTWNTAAFANAQDRDLLVFLLIVDERDTAASALEHQIESNNTLTPILTNRLVPIRVDRDVRPDIAERYAEDRPFQAMLLLPTGEALLILEDELSEWEEKITEADRYRRDHREDIQDRVDEFWSEYENTQYRAPRAPEQSDLAFVDAAVRQFAENAVKDTSAGIWRVDISAYLALRGETEPWAYKLRQQIHAARDVMLKTRFADVWVLLPADAYLQMRLDERAWLTAHPQLQEPDSLRQADVQPEFDVTLVTASSKAMAYFLDPCKISRTYPGRWLNFVDTVESALPHLPKRDSGLDGYLIDALAWLEYLVADTCGIPLSHATTLADSMWVNLWSPTANALRDKPLGETPVREIELFPRPQLGRAACLLDSLAARTGQSLYRRRADSCLAGFAPYAEDAGAAAAYYGIALLKRSRPGS